MEMTFKVPAQIERAPDSDGNAVPPQDTNLTGQILYTPMTYTERLKLVAEMDYENSDGVARLRKTLERQVALVDAAKKRILKVDVHKKNGFHIQSIEQLEIDGDCAVLLSKFGEHILGGVQLGEP